MFNWWLKVSKNGFGGQLCQVKANLEAISGDFNRLKFLVAMFDCVMMERAGLKVYGC